MKQAYAERFAPHFRDLSRAALPVSGPLVSILMPYYDNQAYVDDAIASVLDQSYTHWELILVDDGSPDDYFPGLKEKYPDPRLRFFAMPANAGAAATRNHAFSVSRGDYIVCFDPDDIMHETFLALLMQQAMGPEKPDLVIQDILCFGAFEQLWQEQVRTERELTLNNWITGIALARRDIWTLSGGQDTSDAIRFGSQDWEFWLRVSLCLGRALVVSHVPYPIALYRRHDRSVSSRSELYEYRIRQYIHDRHRAIFERYGTGGAFLADGFLRSARAHLGQRQFGQAARILLLSLFKVPPAALLKQLASRVRTRLGRARA